MNKIPANTPGVKDIKSYIDNITKGEVDIEVDYNRRKKSYLLSYRNGNNLMELYIPLDYLKYLTELNRMIYNILVIDETIKNMKQ